MDFQERIRQAERDFAERGPPAPPVPPALTPPQEARLAVCAGPPPCGEYHETKGAHRCRLCACEDVIRRRIRCPVGRW